MLLPTPVKFRKHRGRIKHRAAVAPPGLMLINVEDEGVVDDQFICTLRFNVSDSDSLNDVSGADAGTWTVRYQGVRYAGVLLSNEGSQILQLTMDADHADAGADEIGYANDPSDISDSTGRQLAAFSGMAF